MAYLSDIEIAQQCEMKHICDIAKKADVDMKYIEQYGNHKAKIDLSLLNDTKDKKDGKLILVTAITPTPAGEGKTTTTIGLADGMSRIGKKVTVALREPSLGPVFGVKGGAAGGGYAQVVPMEDINLHFTGDFHAITSANNLLAAMLDNHIQQGNNLGIDVRRITWKRCLDMNDRQLRFITDGLGGRINGTPREDGFDISVASEVMAVFCLANSVTDLKERLSRIIVGYTYDNKPVTCGELKAAGAMTALLKDAIKPNLVQTLEGTPAFVHGGPFANIAHGCNSIIATKTAMSLADYVITEAGFGADLGAEKFLNIKCRKSGLKPDLTVLVATLNGLKMHGGTAIEDIQKPDAEGVKKGFANIDRHIKNLKSFGQTVVVCFNKYASDTEEEINLVKEHCAEMGVSFALNNAWAEGGTGAVDLANLVVETIENNPSGPLQFTYSDDQTIKSKIETIAKNIYGAANVSFSAIAKKKIAAAEKMGFTSFPVCIAKTQYSFSQDPKAYGAPEGFNFDIKDIVINSGSEMIVAIAGDIIRMPGLPKAPQALKIDIVDGVIEGLS